MRFLIKTVLIFILISAVYNNSFSQDKSDDLINIEVLFEKLFYAQNDSVKNTVNKLIIEKLNVYSRENKDLDIDFKDIKNLSVIKSDDDYIYILTWAVQFSKKKLQYFGFIKYYNQNRGDYYVDELIENQEIKEDYINKKIFPDAWYGAFYYKIISVKYKGERHYVLLGWDGNDDFTNKKLIDILYLEDDDTPVFGKKIIEYADQSVLRLVFEFGERVSMMLRYDEKTKQIIWDHLSPSKQELTGYYKYYGPDLSFDALYFKDGIWKYFPDIELNN